MLKFHVDKYRLIIWVSKLHGYIYRVTGGRIGHNLGSISFILLTTIGRQSGKKRNVPLAAISYGDSYLLIASFGGSPVNPHWLSNIRSNPKVSVRYRSVSRQGMASVICSNDGRYEGMWMMASKVHAGFNDYRAATSRDIPIVIVS